jgi:hypothetical protein
MPGAVMLPMMHDLLLQAAAEMAATINQVAAAG